ncbi:MAG: RagB/SusD family nutrient uptake outer membrane protein [Bacteroidales bacterium]
MKKIILYIIGLSSMLALSACNEWLKVYPEGELPKEDMFSDEAGFENAMTGVYIAMKEQSVYGANLSTTTIEYLVSSWDVTGGSNTEDLGLFNYGNTAIETTFEDIFQQQYFTIAEINSILSALDDKQDGFTTDGLYGQIKGECLGLRAYIHFDILRMFGPVPGTETSAEILPYVTVLSKDNHSYSTYLDYKKALEDDMAEAESLLAESEKFGNYADRRHIRMNAETVRAMQARAALWFGEKEKAYQLAKGVIDSTATRLGGSADFTKGDYNLICEQLFGLHIYTMYEYFQLNFEGQMLKKGTNASLVNTDLYENSNVDIRRSALWKLSYPTLGDPAYIIRKYEVSDGTPASFDVDYRRVPMIRLSEMYFIATETAPDATTAQVYWDEFRESRDLPSAPLPNNETAFKNEMTKEFRKEFFAEGQAFYAYKRLNTDKAHFLWIPTEVTTINYVVPLPKDEVYGSK